jgi:hypothetical protein
VKEESASAIFRSVADKSPEADEWENQRKAKTNNAEAWIAAKERRERKEMESTGLG